MPAPYRKPKRKEDPHRINGRITAQSLRVIDENGEQLGVLDKDKALKLAREKQLDLVEVADKASPPVCRLMNYSKFLYQQERKAREARRHRQRPPHQIRLRPTIADNDYLTKRNHIQRFVEKGDKVRVTVVFKGRQNAHPELGEQILARLAEDLEGVAAVEQKAKKEGSSIVMMLGPKQVKKTPEDS